MSKHVLVRWERNKQNSKSIVKRDRAGDSQVEVACRE